MEVLGNRFCIEKKIGRGAFGELWLIVSDSGQKLAKKTIDNDKYAVLEANILSSLAGHQNVLTYVHHQIDIQDPKKFILVTEFIEGYTLEEFNDDGGVGENISMFLFKQLIEGLLFVHERRICHRDIKPSNLMVSKKDRGRLFLKIIDFGMAEFFQNEDGQEILLDPCEGISNYLPPEVWMNKKCHGRAFDTWMSGIILVEMLCGGTPWKRADPDDDPLFQQWIDEEVIVGLPTTGSIYSLVRMILSIEQQQRPNDNEVIDWLNQNRPTVELDIISQQEDKFMGMDGLSGNWVKWGAEFMNRKVLA